MSNTMTQAAEAAAKAAAAATGVKKPQPLTRWESWTAVGLVVLGLALIAATLIAFGGSNSNFTFKTKQQTTTEPAQTSGTKVTKETDYAETVTIFALTIGAAFVLAGGFYGRLRTLKLGALELGLAGEEEKKEVAEKAAEKIADKVDDSADASKKDAAKVAAQQVAVADLDKVAALGMELTGPVVEGIADQAAKKVAAAIN